MKLTQKQTARFWSKVDMRGPDECWLWKAYTDKAGYGTVSINYKMFQAHHISFLLYYGELPRPMGLHSCDTPSCVNPRHIHAGTSQQNTDEMRDRGRMSVGTQHYNARLDDMQILEIRRKSDSQRKLAKKFGVSQTTIRRIQQRIIWKHT